MIIFFPFLFLSFNIFYFLSFPPGVFIDIIIIFPFWWPACSKHSNSLSQATIFLFRAAGGERFCRDTESARDDFSARELAYVTALICAMQVFWCVIQRAAAVGCHACARIALRDLTRGDFSVWYDAHLKRTAHKSLCPSMSIIRGVSTHFMG